MNTKISRVVSSKIIFLTIVLAMLVLFSLESGYFLVHGESENAESNEVTNNDIENPGIIGAFRENSIKGPQYIEIKDYKLKITGLVADSIEYTYGEVINNHKSYKKVVELNCVEGWSVTTLWEGVLVKDLIEKAKPSLSASVIIFHAYDGYSTSFPISYILDNNIIFAYKMNNETLTPERGFPFELVTEDKWGYKWIKWITEIELSDDMEYKGYWESRGYSNSGNLDGTED